MSMIQDNLVRILDRIKQISTRLGRNPDDIILIGVTKFADVAQVKEAVRSGVVHIGENRVQEARTRFLALGELSAQVTKHMIGHLQTNKVKQALEIFDVIQSVDSIKLAGALDAQASKRNKSIDILVQVNASGEKQKFGVPSSEVVAVIDEMANFTHLRVQGLMTIAPLGQDKNVIRQCFRDLRGLRDQVAEKFTGTANIAMKYLSMGMTDDFEIALEEGANMVRIGRAIFQ